MIFKIFNNFIEGKPNDNILFDNVVMIVVLNKETLTILIKVHDKSTYQ